jgi:spore maturation protein CgeB
MNKVLIVGPDFYNYNQSIERAFQKLGSQTRVLSYSPGEVKSLKEKLQYYTSLNKNAFFDKVKNGFNKAILEQYFSFLPDIVFIIQGNYVFKRTVEKMNCKKVLWMMDSIFRAKGAYAIRHNVDYIFLFEKTDVGRLWQEDKIRARFLPLAVDETIYYPTVKQNKIDILFVGALYQKRVELLERIMKRFDDKTMLVYGRYYSPLKRPIHHFTRKNKKVFLNKLVSPKEVNMLYNQSSICLNIHHDQSRYGVNQRFFEILGSCSFHLVDDNPYIHDNFLEDEIIIYHSEEELFQKIEMFLNDKAAAMEVAERGYKKVVKDHTFTHRIKEVLETIGHN